MAKEPAGKARRRKRHRHMNPFLYLILVVAASAVLAGAAWLMLGDVFALNKPSRSAVITVEKTTTVQEVARMLKDSGLIEYQPLFRLFCRFTKVRVGTDPSEKIRPGTYELNTNMDYNALVNAMSAKSGSRLTVSVTIPEGYTIDQIFALLEEKKVLERSVLQETAANYDFKFSFLKGVLPLGDYHRLEGYLFPDTYEFYMGGGESEAVQALNKMILRFDQQFPDSLRKKADDIGYSVHDIVTIASLIEKETDGSDQAHIASVIYNRLERPTGETLGFLQIDASIVYALGRTITQADYSAETPYNTYLHKGLPPGPIASPGMTALNAALNPESTRDYYYVLGRDGKHHYFRTHAEQLNYISQMNANRG